MPLTNQHADQIADLLNTHNQLVVQYDRAKVLQHADNFVVRLDDGGNVVGVIEVKDVQWYQAELCHLTVDNGHRGRGHGKALLQEAERRAVAQRKRILQCTIRAGNKESRGLFESAGFRFVSEFFYPRSGNDVGVFQKVISPRPG